MPFTIPNESAAAWPDQAEPDAVDVDVLVAALAGTGVVSGAQVTAQGTPDMTLAVAVGVVKVGATVVAVTAGNVTITTAHATNPRFDLVVANNAGTKSVTAGAAAANPVFPAIPASSAVLAAVYVPANDTAIGSTQIVDKRALIGVAKAPTQQVKTVGSGTYTTPAGCVAFLVEMVAGGGGGGGTPAGVTGSSFAQGGCSAGYLRKLIATPDATYAYTVGAKGTGGVGGNGGTAGADSTFGAGGGLLTAKGGPGGATMTNGTTAAGTDNNAGAAASTGGDVNVGGMPGEAGLRITGTAGHGGNGAPSFFGGGGNGRVDTGTAGAALAYGAGGGGTASTTNATGTGGAGLDGIIIVTEYYA